MQAIDAIALAASAALILMAALTPVFSNRKTPRNLRKWYAGNQAAVLLGAAGIGLLIVWGAYIAFRCVNG